MRASVRFGGYVLLAVGIVLFGSSLLLETRVSRAAGSATALQPPSQVVQLGDPLKIDIAVSGVTDLAGWEVRIKYDPSILEFASIEPTSWMDSTGRSTFCPSPSVDAVAGNAQMGCGTVDPSPPGPDGDGVVAHVTFSTIATGTSNLEIIKLELSNPSGDDCCGYVTPNEGVVRVASAADAGSGDGALPPTPTPNPVKLTPTPGGLPRTPGAALPGDQLRLTPGAGGSLAADAAPPAPGETSAGAEVAGDAGDVSGSQARQGASRAPNAGTGPLAGVASNLVQTVAAALALAGLACVLAAKTGTLRRVALWRWRR